MDCLHHVSQINTIFRENYINKKKQNVLAITDNYWISNMLQDRYGIFDAKTDINLHCLDSFSVYCCTIR